MRRSAMVRHMVAVFVAASVLLTGLFAMPPALRSTAAAGTVTSGSFVPIPARPLLDTRKAKGTPGTDPISAHTSVTFPVAGQEGVPASGVTAVALSVHALGCATEDGTLSVHPSDQPSSAPTVSFYASKCGADAADLVPLTATGMLTVSNYSDGDIHSAVYVRGYFTDAARQGDTFHYIADPTQYDENTGTTVVSSPPTTPIGAGETVTVGVAGESDIPTSGATAAAFTLTVSDQTKSGWVSVYPSDQTDPQLASLNYRSGETTRVLEVTQLSSTGELALTNHGAVPISISVVFRGYFQAPGAADEAMYEPVGQHLLLNTADGTGIDGGGTVPLDPGASLTFDATTASGQPWDTVAAVAADITASAPTETGGLSVYPAGSDDPVTTSIDFAANRHDVSEFGLLEPGDSGGITVTNHSSGTVQVRVDARGYFIAQPEPVPDGVPTTPPADGDDTTQSTPGLYMCAVPGLTPEMKSFPRWSWLGKWSYSNDPKGPRTCGYRVRKSIVYVCWSDAAHSLINIVGNKEASEYRHQYSPKCDGKTHSVPMSKYSGLRVPYHVHWWRNKAKAWNQVGLGLY